MNKIVLIVIGMAILAFFVITSQKGVPTQPQTTPKQPTSSPSTSVSGKNKVKIFLVALEDAGKQGKKFGCDDSLISEDRDIPQTDKIEDKIKGALETLLTFKDNQYTKGGTYSALANADIKVESVNVMGDVAEVLLSGALRLGGECDDPRVVEQLKETILQFPEVKKADIYLNGRSLDDVLSLKGGE